jgi:hypothetical protein
MTDNNTNTLNKTQALLQAMRAFGDETLTGVPTADMANPIADTGKLFGAALRVNELIRSLALLPTQANDADA